MSPSHVLTCSASSPHQPDALKAKGQRHDDDIWLSKWKRIISHLLSGDSSTVFGPRRIQQYSNTERPQDHIELQSPALIIIYRWLKEHEICACVHEIFVFANSIKINSLKILPWEQAYFYMTRRMLAICVYCQQWVNIKI